MKNKHLFKVVSDYVMMTFACAIFAVCWEWFMIPNNMSAGGLMGLCTIVQYATGGIFQAQYGYIAINVLLIGIAVLALGIGFGFRTIFCIAVSSLMLQLASSLPAMYAVEGNFLYVPERVLIPVIAGVLEAYGVGIILRCGGSTGGTDIVALMINKYWPISLSKVFLVSDFVVILLMLVLPDKSFGDCIYGFEMMLTFSLVIDIAVGGQKSTTQLMVFSEKYSKIADYIINEMNRGVTVLRAQGWFTKRDKNVLLLLLSRKELPDITKTIKEIDPRAFMSISAVSGVYGEGFDEIKTGIKDKVKLPGNGRDKD